MKFGYQYVEYAMLELNTKDIEYTFTRFSSTSNHEFNERFKLINTTT
jgi:hypothetical protein